MADDAKNLEIKVKLDRTDAIQEANAHAAQQQQMVDDVQKAQGQMTGVVDAQGRARNAQGQFAARSFKAQMDAQVAASRAAAQSQAADHDKLTSSFGRFVDSGIGGYARMAIGARAAIGLLGTLGDAIQQADERAAKLGRRFIDFREKVTGLATAMGEKPGNEFTIKNAQFNAATGLTQAEGLGFRNEFQNVAAQFKGSKISDAEHAQYEQQAAQYGIAKGLPAEQAGDLAGRLLGFQDRRPLGANASEDALGKFATGMNILSRGGGRPSVNATQSAMLMAAALDPDQLKGSFTDSNQVFTAISMMAESHDARAFDLTKSSIRGLHETKDEAGELNRRAGITPTTPYFDALKQLAPVVEAESRAKNIPVQDVLRQAYKDEQVAEGLAVGINRGVGAGIIDDRTDFARQKGGPQLAQADIDAFRKSDQGRQRLAEAQTALAETNLGADDSGLNVLREQARARLTQRGEIGSTWQIFKDKIANKVSLGGIPDFEPMRIDDEVRQMLMERAGRNYVPSVVNQLGLSVPASVESRGEELKGLMAQLRAQKVDPLAEVRQGETRRAIPITGYELPRRVDRSDLINALAPPGRVDPGAVARAMQAGGAVDPRVAQQTLAEQQKQTKLLEQIARNQAPAPQRTPQMVPNARVGPPPVKTR